MNDSLPAAGAPARPVRRRHGCLGFAALLLLLTFGLWLLQPWPVIRPRSTPIWGTLPINSKMVLNSASSPDRQLVAVAQQDNTLQIWRLADRTRLLTLPIADTEVDNLLFSPDGQLLAIGQRGNATVKVWRVTDGTLLHVFSVFGRPRDIAFSPDSRLLAAAIDGNKEAIRLWQIAGGRLVRDIPVNAQPAVVAFSPDGAHVAVGFQDSRGGWVGLWPVNASDPVPERTFNTGQWAFAVAFSPDGRFLAAGGGASGQDNFIPVPDFLQSHATIRIWDLATPWLPWPAQTLSGPQKYISSLRFSADGRRLIASGETQTDWLVVEFVLSPQYLPWWWPVAALVVVSVVVRVVRTRRARQAG